jgi:ankyrin repeat protein
MGRTKLHYAAQAGDLVAVEGLLLAGAEIDAADNGGWTALHFAAQSNGTRAVQALLERGASIDKQDEHGNTALFRAVFAYAGSGEVVQALLAAGSDPNLANAHGVSPASLARTIANTDVSKYF